MRTRRDRDDTRTDERWAELARAAAEQGCRSTLSYPLPAQEAVAGALNLYARGTQATDERGHTSHYTYDGEGHELTESNALQQTTSYGENYRLILALTL